MGLKDLRNFLGTDCCGEGRNYPMPTARELKDFKDSCSEQEWSESVNDATEHMETHK